MDGTTTSLQCLVFCFITTANDGFIFGYQSREHYAIKEDLSDLMKKSNTMKTIFKKQKKSQAGQAWVRDFISQEGQAGVEKRIC